jgi:hypothetical protein
MASRRKKKSNWIGSAIKRPGQLHRDLGVPQGKPIPKARIRAAAKGSGKTAQRARLALTLQGLRPATTAKKTTKRRKRK